MACRSGRAPAGAAGRHPLPLFGDHLAVLVPDPDDRAAAGLRAEPEHQRVPEARRGDEEVAPARVDKDERDAGRVLLEDDGGGRAEGWALAVEERRDPDPQSLADEIPARAPPASDRSGRERGGRTRAG